MNVFDFTPNVPQCSTEPSGLPRIAYPIAEIAKAESALQLMRPIEIYKQLCDANWPSGPGYYPSVLLPVYSDPASLGQVTFAEAVATAYGQNYHEEKLDFWRETKFFGERLVYVKKAVDEYLEGDYISSIYVLVPQFEGIIRDYLSAAAGTYRYRIESCIKDLKNLVVSRTVLMFPRQVLDIIFSFVEDGSFLTETGKINDPAMPGDAPRRRTRSIYRIREQGHRAQTYRATRRACPCDPARQDTCRQALGCPVPQSC
jgi:hypothetical protein